MEAEAVHLERFRLTPKSAREDFGTERHTARPPRHRKGERFLRGPIPWPWLTQAMPLGRAPLAMALVIWRLVGVKNSRIVHLTRSEWECVGGRRTIYRALDVLERAGLITVERHRGRGPMVEVCETP